MRQIFKIFFQAESTNPWIVLVCLLIGGLAEAVGFGTLLPVVSALMNDSAGPKSPFEKIITDSLATIGVNPSFGNLIALVVIILVVRSILLFTAMSYAGISSARLTNRLRTRLIRAIFNANWRFYANQSGGRIATVLSNDATRAGDAYLMSAVAVASFVQVFAYAAVAIFLNWRVAFVGMAGGALIAVASGSLVKVMRKAGQKQTTRVGTLTADTIDMLQNIKALKSMNRYVALIDNLSVVLKKVKRTLYTQNFARFGLAYGIDGLVAVLIGAGAYFAHVYGQMPLQQLLVFGVLVSQLVSYTAKLLKAAQNAVQIESAYRSVADLINLAESQREEITTGKAPVLGKGCYVESVSFAHGETNTLDNISIEIPVNKITVLQGPSGAGKTTLLDLLVGFHRADSGKIRIGEDPIETINLAQWRNMIGYVPQELALFHDTVRANITLLETDIQESDIEKAIRLSGVSAFLDVLPLGLETDVGEFGGKLSGGQRQRISLARALVKNPKVLILDEVTSALDPSTEAAIVSNIAELRGQYTIIAITHRPAWTEIADRLYKLDGGKATLQKSPARKAKV